MLYFKIIFYSVINLTNQLKKKHCNKKNNEKVISQLTEITKFLHFIGYLLS
jgi:hypothetical protein